MANHKRKRAKKQRAGCLLCKPWKANGAGKTDPVLERPADRRKRLVQEQEIEENKAGEGGKAI